MERSISLQETRRLSQPCDKFVDMKKWFFILLIMSVRTTAQHNMSSLPDKAAIHGMLIFGTQKIYASHLPLFHPPHDYQIILELQLDDLAKQKFITDQQNHPEYTTYTIEPEKFILPEMIASPRPFKVNLYRGHFERGGVQIAADLTVQIRQVIYFKKFTTAETRDAVAGFIVFGDNKERFAVHRISNKPDFEQIIQVKTEGELLTADKYKLLTVVEAGNTPVGVSGNIIKMKDVNNSVNVVY